VSGEHLMQKQPYTGPRLKNFQPQEPEETWCSLCGIRTREAETPYGPVRMCPNTKCAGYDPAVEQQAP
jgi:hypothetical protein